MSDLSLSFSQPMSFSSCFFSPVQLRRWIDRGALVGTRILARVNPPHLLTRFAVDA